MPTQENVLSIIKKMRKTGESEEKILQNLIELGIDEENAKKILLLSQGDIENTIQVEINESVKAQLAKEKKELMAELLQQLKADEKEALVELEKKIQTDKNAYEKQIENRIASEETRLGENVTKALEISQLAREKVVLQEQRLKTMEIGTYRDPTSERKHSSKPLAIGLWILGLAAAGATIYYIFQNQSQTFTGENFPIVIGMATFSVVIMYLSTLV